MRIAKAYKTELAPNNKQVTYLKQCCGTARYVYNWGLAEWKRQYEAWKETIKLMGVACGVRGLEDSTVKQEVGNANKSGMRSVETQGGLHCVDLTQIHVGIWRDHHTHQISNYATAKTKPGVIVLEDLNVKGMMSNHHLARSVANASMREIRRQIEYKAEWLDIDVLIADRWFPSSKTCRHCGHKNDGLSLSDREWVCENCGAVIDRDYNAAKNLAALAGER